MTLPVCTLCGKPYPFTGTPYRCECGGIYDYAEFPPLLPGKVDETRRDLWQFRSMFGFPDDLAPVSLGEGNTPLVELGGTEKQVLAKLEYLNPTGSYKDRGSTTLMSFLASRGVHQVVEDSSGNAGASLAAYAARAGVAARVYVPAGASGPKRRQIEIYGAELALVPGARSEAAKAVLKAAASGIPYASHAFMPFGLVGIATIAYEIARDLGGQTPGTVIAPVGHGGLFYGIIRGFEALSASKGINNNHLPYFLGVQAAGCAPVFEAYQNHEFTLREPHESDTIAEGVRVTHPIRGEAILRKLSEISGRIIQIKEEELLVAYQELAMKGFFVEPTSALVWAACKNLQSTLPEPIILILTGAGTKTQF